MKKTMFGLFAFVLMASSYQLFYMATSRLIVHETNDMNSAVCFDGKAEDYYGQCVSTVPAETPQYNKKMQLINSQK